MHVQAITTDTVLAADVAPVAAARRGTRLYTFCRYATAAWMILYGFAKVFGLQFGTTPSIGDMPLRLVGGQQLAWAFFGYSSVYATLIALAEIAGGALLLWRRTTLAGALVLLPVMLNVLVLDVFYGIDAFVVVLLLLGMIVYILGRHAPALLDVLRAAPEQVYGRQPPVAGAARSAATWLLRAAVVAIPIYATWAARGERTRPFALRGTWSVARRERPAGQPSRVSPLDFARTVYIERWGDDDVRAVLRSGESFVNTELRFDSIARTVRLGEPDRARGGWIPLFSGTYARSAGGLVLQGTAGGAPLRLELAPARR